MFSTGLDMYTTSKSPTISYQQFHQMLGRLSIILVKDDADSDKMEALLFVHSDDIYDENSIIYRLRNGSSCTVEDMFIDCECHFFIICYRVSTHEFVNHTLLLLMVSSSLYVSHMFVTRVLSSLVFQSCPSLELVSPLQLGYTFTPCVGSFISPGIDTR